MRETDNGIYGRQKPPTSYAEHEKASARNRRPSTARHRQGHHDVPAARRTRGHRPVSVAEKSRLRERYDAMAEDFEKNEHQLFGADGFETMTKRVANLEQQIGIDDLAKFT